MTIIPIEAGRRLTAGMLSEIALRGQVVGEWQRISNQSIPSGPGAAIAWDSTVLDRLQARQPPPNNSRIQPTMPGWYMFTAQVSFSTNSQGSNRSAIWYKNGNIIPGGVSRPLVVMDNQIGDAIVNIPAVSILIDMNGTTDYVELFASHNAGVNITTSGGNNVPICTLTYAGPPDN